ncbi:hypothetical protein HDU96_000189 [Phlyctochytrium bullatum]|nr:hypothetical protein HDU96_000189 [Phlyctochytrium bullatum]
MSFDADSKPATGIPGGDSRRDEPLERIDAAIAQGPRMGGFGGDGLDEIQRFKQAMKEKERLERERNGLPPEPVKKPIVAVADPSALETSRRPATTPSSAVDMMFKSLTLDPSKTIFDDGLADNLGKGDSMGSFQSGSLGSNESLDRGFSEPKPISRFNKFFDDNGDSRGDTNNPGPNGNPLGYLERIPPAPIPADKQQASIEILTQLGLLRPNGPPMAQDGPSPQGMPYVDAGSQRHPMKPAFEDEMMSQFVASKVRENSGVPGRPPGMVDLNNMERPLEQGRTVSEEEIIQRQIMQQLMQGQGKSAPISVPQGPSLPRGVKVLTEEEFLRMQRQQGGGSGPPGQSSSPRQHSMPDSDPGFNGRNYPNDIRNEGAALGKGPEPSRDTEQSNLSGPPGPPPNFNGEF